ncbi:MAG: glycosyltransferase [Bacteriovoracia bacterium]
MSENRRILHLIKTLDGATWAFHQILELRRLGWDVHIAAPTNVGRFLSDMQKTGAPLHVLPVEFPVKTPWLLPRHSAGLKNLVQELNPALIHSHFVSTTHRTFALPFHNKLTAEECQQVVRALNDVLATLAKKQAA